MQSPCQTLSAVGAEKQGGMQLSSHLGAHFTPQPRPGPCSRLLASPHLVGGRNLFTPHTPARIPQELVAESKRNMDDFNSETDSDYTSYWRDWVGTLAFCPTLNIVAAILVTIAWILYDIPCPSWSSITRWLTMNPGSCRGMACQPFTTCRI